MQEREEILTVETTETELDFPVNQESEQKFAYVETLGLFGRRLEHDAFFAELQRQKENRRDYLFEPSQGRFDGTQFIVGNQSYTLDPIALYTLAERFKMNGGHTVTRNGLMELSNNTPLFQEVTNYFLHLMDKPLQFRTLYDVGIAFPSQQYTIVNHIDLMSMICDTLTAVFEEEAKTKVNFLSKELMYSFIPIPDCERVARHFRGFEDKLSLGLEVRNSEILQNGIVVNFKIVREMSSNGFLLADEISSVYQKHINLTTAEALQKVQEEMLFMFQDEGIPLALAAMENLQTLMETTVVNGQVVAREFARLINLTDSETENLIRVGTLQNDNTAYGWTIGSLSYIAQTRSNRNKQEQEERLGGKFLIDQELLRNLLDICQ